jgi:hypothetical protein
MNIESMISPSSSATFGFSTVILPPLAISSMRTVRALSRVIDFSPW